jgi:hypothetical protein
MNSPGAASSDPEGSILAMDRGRRCRAASLRFSHMSGARKCREFPARRRAIWGLGRVRACGTCGFGAFDSFSRHLLV